MPAEKITFEGDSQSILESLNQIDQRLGKHDQQLASTTSALTKFGASFLTLETARRVFDLAKLGEDIQDVRTAFNRMVDDGEAGMQRLRQAVNNTVDDHTLRKLASDALATGLSFDQITTAFAFAKQKAEDTGQTFAQTLDIITTALARVQEGGAGASRALIPLGINGQTVNEVLGRMVQYLEQSKTGLDENSDAAQRFETNLTNLRQNFAEFTVKELGGFLEGMNNLLLLLNGNEFQTAATKALTGFPRVFGSDSADAKQAFQLMKDFQLEFSRQGATVERLQTVFDALTEIQQKSKDLYPEQTQAVIDYQAAVKNLLDIQSKPVNSVVAKLTPLGPDAELGLALALSQSKSDLEDINLKLADVNRKLEQGNIPLQEQIKLQREQTDLLRQKQIITDRIAQQTVTDNDKEKSAAIEKLNLQRAEIKAKISLGQATYEDLKNLVDQQKQLYLEDYNFQISLLQDLAAIRQNDNNQRQQQQSHIANEIHEYGELILTDETRSYQQRLVDRVQFYQQAFQLENLDMEHKKQLYEYQKSAEADLNQYIQQQYQERLQFLQNTFGQVFIQFFDDLLDGNLKRFDQYLKDLLKLILKFLIQSAIFRLFTAILGGPATLIPGLPGGGQNDYHLSSTGGGINPFANSGLLDSLAGRISRITSSPAFIQNRFNPSINLPGQLTTVQILATPEQLYALTQTGQHHSNKTKLT